MAANLNAYLSFAGTARDAMTFYQSIFGGELDLRTFADFQMPVEEGEQDLVMHSMLTAPDGLVLMGADAPSHMGTPTFGGFSLSLSGDEAERLTGYFEALSDGATINQPLEQAPWGDTFGMLTDRFGVDWLVNITAQVSA